MLTLPPRNNGLIPHTSCWLTETTSASFAATKARHQSSLDARAAALWASPTPRVARRQRGHRCSTEASRCGRSAKYANNPSPERCDIPSRKHGGHACATMQSTTASGFQRRKTSPAPYITKRGTQRRRRCIGKCMQCRRKVLCWHATSLAQVDKLFLHSFTQPSKKNWESAKFKVVIKSAASADSLGLKLENRVPRQTCAHF